MPHAIPVFTFYPPALRSAEELIFFQQPPGAADSAQKNVDLLIVHI
jgi:hypothetical protein